MLVELQQAKLNWLQVPITFSDASSRGGTYYLPPGYHGNARPLMVAFHGLDGHGSDMVTTFMVRLASSVALPHCCAVAASTASDLLLASARPMVVDFLV